MLICFLTFVFGTDTADSHPTLQDLEFTARKRLVDCFGPSRQNVLNAGLSQIDRKEMTDVFVMWRDLCSRYHATDEPGFSQGRSESAAHEFFFALCLAKKRGLSLDFFKVFQVFDNGIHNRTNMGVSALAMYALIESDPMGALDKLSALIMTGKSLHPFEFLRKFTTPGLDHGLPKTHSFINSSNKDLLLISFLTTSTAAQSDRDE